MKLKILIIPILLFTLLSFRGFGQTTIEAIKTDCPNAIVKDSTTFVFKDWIKKEIPKDSLIDHGEKAYSEIWAIPDDELQNDSLLTFHYNQGKKSFIADLEILKNKLQNDDKIYLYSSSVSNWNTLTGEVGIVVLRACKLIDIYVIARS